MAGCRAPLLHACVASWLAVVLPFFMRVLLHGWLSCSPAFMRVGLHSWLLCPHAAGGCAPVAGAGILQAGVVVLPGCWWICPRGWCRYPSGWCCCPSWWLVDVSPWLVVPPGILARIFTAGHVSGYTRHPSVRRRSPSKSKFQRNKNERLLLYISII